MTSLTPQHRSAEVVDTAFKEGLVTSAYVLIPALGGLYAALQNPTFRKVK